MTSILLCVHSVLPIVRSVVCFIVSFLHVSEIVYRIMIHLHTNTVQWCQLGMLCKSLAEFEGHSFGMEAFGTPTFATSLGFVGMCMQIRVRTFGESPHSAVLCLVSPMFVPAY